MEKFKRSAREKFLIQSEVAPTVAAMQGDLALYVASAVPASQREQPTSTSGFVGKDFLTPVPV
ncbi:hypothetical protein JQ557_31920 [Bradyrhizobium sp. U87765 SZCCT0131]|uniref:hypothetical protein n=1 Tax=unclassified Bradyrhizobium TaxID=2631580 RepID=UPI001BAE00BA|nr:MULTISPECIES: hypothetical protein [unclassified Bradyrhizobium]MBR1222645.1 hypothetical protein [Bradyrhizobium sp. U87765 SZCCT0131]MBR1265274.1 hypothetical protein [Bradyrhizobium sp. U87765 SZCCT0134]MBR1302947.1 hypothetical protein [Bradyrhizobium sp. U87765 SZCCT0110]MBR1323645.1 hypothetical protein [Bradyrhizobium sp. U87765 SZCCT0109]MBR1346876.1 hypothetical protein [Bradyrhizobium sp. U87765 SZCCT0048]